MPQRVASLGMYDRPELQAANDQLWRAIADRLAARGVDRVPTMLDRSRLTPAIWDDPDLLLAQCCGYPLVTDYRDRLRYVATPRYRVAGCAGARYRSRIVVRSDDPAEKLADLRNRRGAVNQWQSNSGMNLFRAALAPLAGRSPFFSEVIVTGGHDFSARAVAEARADVAAIDIVSFAHLQRWEPHVTRQLRTIAWTSDTPGLPLVTASDVPDEVVGYLREILCEVANDHDTSEALRILLIDGFEHVPLPDYEEILALERRSARAGYRALA